MTNKLNDMKTTDTIIYRGAEIEPASYGGGFEWYHPDYYDVDITGDKWNSSYHVTGAGSGSTIEECKEDIDDFLNDKS